MNRILCLLLLSATIISACHKSDISHTPDPAMTGSWKEYLAITGYGQVIPLDTNSVYLLNLNADGTYQFTKNGTVTNSGNISLSSIRSDNYRKIVFSNISTDSHDFYIQQTNIDSLRIEDMNKWNGGFTFYTRVK